MTGDWNVETALAVLEDALNRCPTEDVRTAEVFAALEFLSTRASGASPFLQFKKSLDLTGPSELEAEGRWQTLHASVNAIKVAVNR